MSGKIYKVIYLPLCSSRGEYNQIVIPFGRFVHADDHCRSCCPRREDRAVGSDAALVSHLLCVMTRNVTPLSVRLQDHFQLEGKPVTTE